MQTLANPRHERFAQDLANGLTADQAYVSAGYVENRKNAARLKSREVIERRVAELLTARAKKNEDSDITLASVLADIRTACDMAQEHGQSNVVLNAAALKAKLGGLMVDKLEVGGPGDFAGCNGHAEVLAKLTSELGDDTEVMLEALDLMRDAVLKRASELAKVIEPPRDNVDHRALKDARGLR